MTETSGQNTLTLWQTLDEITRIKTETLKREKGEQDHFLEIRDPILVPVEGRDEVVLCWVVEVAELCVYESFHPCGGLVHSIPFVSAIGSEYEGFLAQAHLDVSVCVGGDSHLFPFKILTFLLPHSSRVCAIPSVIQVQLVPLWIFNRREQLTPGSCPV